MSEELGSLLVVMEASTALLRQQMAEGERAVERTTRGMTASLDKVNTLFGLMDRAASQSAKNVGASLARARRETDINAWGAELDRLQSKYDKTFAATRRFESEVADLNRALKVGAISADVYQESLADIERRSNPATVAIRQQAQALDQLRSKYDPVHAEVRRYGEELTRAEAVLKAANASDAERARILRGVADAYDPATRAAREHAQAAQAAADAQRRVVEQARATQNQGTAQHWYNTTLGVTNPGRSGSAAASAAVFQEAAEAAEKEAAALAKLDARARALRESIDPATKAQRLYNDAVRDADDLLDRGKITYAEYTAAVHKAQAALGATTGAHTAVQRSTRLTAFEMTNLSFQLQDIGVSLAGGQNPFLVMAQQLPQATMAVGGLNRALSLVLSPAGAIVLAVTAGAAALGAAFLAAETYSNSIREVERVNRLTGGAVGLSTGALVEQSDALAGAAGLSRSSAREIQAAYVATGRIGSAVLGDLVTVTKDWAALTGQDLDKAKEELGEFFSSPARAAEDLTRKISLFSDAQLEAIRAAEAQGRVGQAQALLLDGIKQRAAGAAHNVSDLTKGLDAAGRLFSDFFDALGQSNGLQTTEQRVGALADEVERLRDAANADAMRVFAETGGGVPAEWVPVDDRYAARGAGSAGQKAGLDAAGQYYEAVAQASASAFNAFVTGESEAAKRLEKIFKDLSRAVDPVVQAQQNLLNVEKLLDLAVDKGVASRSEAARVLGLYREQVIATLAPTQAFALEMERQARVMEAAAGRARDFETQRQAALQKRGVDPAAPLTPQEEDDINRGLDRKYGATAADQHRTMVQATDDARTLAAATAALSPSAMVAAQAQVAYNQKIRETTDAMHPHGDVAAALQAKNDALAKGMAELSGQLGAQESQLRVATQQQAFYAAAAGQGEAAQRRARIESEVLAAAYRDLGPATRAALEAQEDFTRTQIHRDFAGQIEEEVLANERLAAAVLKGADAARDAEVYNKAVAQTLREVPYPKAGQDTAAWNRALAENVRLLNGQRNAADNVDLSRYLTQLKDARKGLEFQRSTLGMSDDAKALAQAEFEASEYVRQRYGDYEKLDPATKAVADNVMAQAKANATLSTEIKHAESAYAAVGDAIDNGVVRPLEAAVDAIVKGQGESVKWGNVLKGAFASVGTDLLKMGTVNPLMNMAGIGSYRPSLWDLPMFSASGGGSPAAVQVQAMPGGGQSLTGMATNWGLGKAASWGFDKVFGGTGGVGAVDSIGMALGFGAPEIAGSALAAGYVAPTAMVNGIAVPVSAEVAASQVAMLQAANAGTTGTLGGGVTASSLPSLSAIGGGVIAPAMIGGAGGAYLSNTFMGGSKIGGALAGGALGAGAAYGAKLMGLGAGLGPWGIVAAAVIAAVMAAIGSQKPAQPWGGGAVFADSTGKITKEESGGENGIEGEDLLKRAKYTNTVLSTVNKSADITYGLNKPLPIYTEYQGDRGDEAGDGHQTFIDGWRDTGVLVSKKEQPGDIALDIYRHFAKEMDLVDGHYTAKTGSLADEYDFEAPDLVIKALQQMGDVSQETGTKILALAASVDRGHSAYDELDKTLAGIGKSAKKTTLSGLDPLKEERDIAKEGGIEAEWKSLIERQIRANWDPTVATYGKASVAIAEVNGRFEAMAETFADLGLNITAAELSAQKNRELEDTLVGLAASGEATVNALEEARVAFPEAAAAIDRAVAVARRAAEFMVGQVRFNAAATLNPYAKPSANSIIAATGMNPADKPELWNKITGALGGIGTDYGTNIDIIGRLAEDIITGHQHLMATNPQAFQSIIQSVTGFAQTMQAQAQTISQGQAQINAAIRGGRAATVAELYQDLGLAADAFPQTVARLTTLFDALDDGTAGAVEWQAAFDGIAANLRTGKITGEQFSALLGEMTTRMQSASQLIASGRSITEWLDKLHSTPLGNSSPQEQATAAMSAFQRQVGLARGGDATAYGNLTGYAETLITAQRALSATGVDTSQVIGWVESTLKSLPAVQSWEAQQAALLGQIAANTSATATGIGGVIGAIGNSGGGGSGATAGLKSTDMSNYSMFDVAAQGTTNALGNRVGAAMEGWWKDAAGASYAWDSSRYLQLNPDVSSFSMTDAAFLDWFRVNVTDPANLGTSFAGNLLKLDQAQRHFVIHGVGEGRRFAAGTASAPPGWAIVGEEGPEWLKLPGGAAIAPNPAAVSMANTWEEAVESWAAPAPVVPRMPDLGGFAVGITAELRAVRDAVDDLAAAVGKVGRDDLTQRGRIAEAFDDTLHRMHGTLEEIERRMRVA